MELNWYIAIIALLTLISLYLIIKVLSLEEILWNKLGISETKFIELYDDYALCDMYRSKFIKERTERREYEDRLYSAEKRFMEQIYRCPECNSIMQRFEMRHDADIVCCNEDCDFTIYADR